MVNSSSQPRLSTNIALIAVAMNPISNGVTAAVKKSALATTRSHPFIKPCEDEISAIGKHPH
jgi:hypothetical protein